MNTGKLNNKIAIVTGAGQGLGEALAKRLAQEGADVVVADINLPNAERVAKEISESYKREALPVLVDVTKSEQVANMVKKTVEKFGRIDILVSNAGILIAEEITDFPEDKWRKVMDVNLVGYFLDRKSVV